MTRIDTEALIQKYLNGETTTEEERRLALEVSREDAPENWKIIAEMLGELTVDEALFDKEMAERRQKSRVIKLWPWVAAACAAALLVVFLTPPRDEVSPQPQTAQTAVKQQQVQPKDKDEAQTKVAEVSNVKQNMGKPQINDKKPLLSRKANHRTSVSTVVVKASQATDTEQVAESENDVRTLTEVEKNDIMPYEDPLMQFAEQARNLRERGNRVMQRVSMNSISLDNFQLNDL